MKHQAWTYMLILLAGAAAGCDTSSWSSGWPSSTPPPGPAPAGDSRARPAPPAAAAAQPARPAAPPAAAQVPNIATVPRSDGQPGNFTILLYVLDNPGNHIQEAELWRQRMSSMAGWKDLFVIHKEGRSDLCWGRYPTVESAQPNLTAAKGYRAQNGKDVFSAAVVIPLPTSDVGPPEWNLRNCRGIATLLVAMFNDDPEQKYFNRQRDAVEYCKRLRQNGYEAWYSHGPLFSNVTIGSFGPDVVHVYFQRFTRGAEHAGELDYQEVMDVPNPLPAKVLAIQKDFPHLAINGQGVNDIVRDPRTNQVVSKSPRQTYLVRTPLEVKPLSAVKGQPGAADPQPSQPDRTPLRPKNPIIYGP